MDEKELKTSLKQRIFIGAIAVLMLGSVIAGYALIVANGGKTSATTDDDSTTISEEKIAKYEAEYEAKTAEIADATKNDQDNYNKFISYKSEIKAFNETSANENGVQIKELASGSGDTIDENSEYLAYYVGYCADGSVFDSTFDDNDNPTSFSKILSVSATGVIEGWTEGVNGMKLGGIRRITIPGEKAYGDSMEICGGYNKPLRFIIMAIAKEGQLGTLTDELEIASMKLQYAQYGIDYEAMMTGE